MANAQQSKTNKSRDSQPTANHAISFTRRPGQLSRSNNQTYLKQNKNPFRTQCRSTSIRRNTKYQSHECLQSFHTHPSTFPGASWETPQFVTLWLCFDDNATRYHNHQFEPSTCTFSSTLCPVALCNELNRSSTSWTGVHRWGIPPQNSKQRPQFLTPKVEVQEGKDETLGRPIQNMLRQCCFICACKWDEVCAFSCNMWAEAASPISSQRRDCWQLVKRMSCHTTDPTKNGTREQFYPWLRRRGVLPTQHQPQSDTELPTWDSIRGTRVTQSSLQTRMWKRWRTLHLEKCYHGRLQRAPLSHNFMVLQLHGAFVLVLLNMLHRCCRGRWGHTCPNRHTNHPLPRYSLKPWACSFFRNVIVSLLSSPLRSNFWRGRRRRRILFSP